MPARWCPGIVWFRPLPFPAKTGRKLAYGGDLAMGERASLNLWCPPPQTGLLDLFPVSESGTH